MSTHALARKYGVHRRTVGRRWLVGAAGRKRPECGRRHGWVSGRLIDSALIADRTRRASSDIRRSDLATTLGRARRGGLPSGRSVGMSVSAASSSASSLTRCSCRRAGAGYAEAEVDWGEAIVVIAAAPRQISPIKRGSRPNWTTPGPAAGGLCSTCADGPVFTGAHG